VIQSLLLAVGFFAIGLPAAGLLTVILLLLCIVQVPAVLVTLPIIAYVLATEATQPAIIFLVWTLIAGLSDNVLKPLLLGRGMEVPMPVILIGVIGGMIADGLLGLFVGPVVLAVGYMLLIEWMRLRRADSHCGLLGALRLGDGARRQLRFRSVGRALRLTDKFDGDTGHSAPVRTAATSVAPVRTAAISTAPT
jgi:AI-2E family transporter